MAGVQWHPEGMEDQLEIFEEFIEICSKNQCMYNDRNMSIVNN